MFKRLRNRLVFMYLISISLVVFAFSAGILLFSFNATNRMTDGMIAREISRAEQNFPVKGHRKFMPRGDGHAFTAAFSVKTNDNFEIIETDSPFFDVEDEFYKDVVECIKNEKREKGSINTLDKRFKYKIEDKENYYLIAVVEITREYNMLKNTAYHFVTLFVPLVALLYILCSFMVRKTTKPVEDAFAKQKEFIADASHELKTPLSVIRTNVDVLHSMADGEQIKWLDYIKLEAGKMTELVNSLLYLAKMDKNENSDNEKSHLPFDLSKLAEDTIMPLEAVFFENNITFESEIQPGIILNGSKEHISRLISIFMDNAVKYSDGRIEFRLCAVQNNIKMEFFNTGTGVKAEDKEKIFDRFYRTDKSRELNGSFGLGLSIARAIVAAHKGKVNVESEYGKWVKFTVLFKIK